MKYALLIYHSETENATMSPEESQALMQAYWGFTNELTAAGANLGGEALHPTSTATSVRVRAGNTLTVDGPFAETKEQLGGLYIVEAENLDDAIAWAAKIPDAATGTVEVRPILEFG